MTIWEGEEGGGLGVVEVCVVVVNVVALVLAIADGRNVYGGGDVTMGEFLIWLSSLLSSGLLSDSSDGAFSGSLNGGNTSFSTGEGSLASLRTSSRS